MVKIIKSTDLELSINFQQVIKQKCGLVLIVGESLKDSYAFLVRMRDLYSPKSVILNLGLQLSQLMLEQHATTIDIEDFIERHAGESSPIFMNHLEILTDVYIQKDPIRTCTEIAKRHLIMLSVSGTVSEEYLDYGPNERKYELSGLSSLALIIKI